MKISFHGAARTVTGSKHILHLNDGKKILLDCGMFQGLGQETVALNNAFGFDPRSLDTVVISHGHIDHIGLLPKLVAEGYDKDIWMTTATADLISIMLYDSANIQESDAAYVNKKRAQQGKPLIKPLYTIADVDKVIPLIKTVPYGNKQEILKGVEVLFTDNGHILGSSTVNLTIKQNGKPVQLAFSGDIGRYRDVLLKSPEVFPQADYIIMESTYGAERHEKTFAPFDKLYKLIEEICVQNKGKLIIPAFSLGRTQELLFALNRLELERRWPNIPVYVDSPLSSKLTAVIKTHTECFNKHVQELLRLDEDVFDFKGLHFTQSVDESIALNSKQGPMIIISASGMAEAGRIKHHIANNIQDPNACILIVGYCEPQSLGARLQNKPDEVSIFGTRFQVRARIESMRSMSAHGDFDDLSQWLACQDPTEVKKLFLVHGEYDVQMQFKTKLMSKGFKDVTIPDLHDTIGLGE